MKNWRLVYLLILFIFAVYGLILWCNSVKMVDRPSEGVLIYKSAPTETAVATERLYDEYVEGEGDPPDWWNPDEPMAIEWVNPQYNAQQSDIVRYNAPVYWNPDGLIYGWNGHTMEQWEMEMFSRIAYLECRGCSRECQEAVVDAILRLWESEYYSTTMYGTLSAVNEDGTYAYSPYPTMWDEEYDPDILAEMRELCEERFYNAPEYTAPFFRTKYYHDWAEPCYAFLEDNVYFSTGKGWN